ncbi:MAG: HDOD domain-containing protein [Gammaproteobacteria bacterium]|nr:HDOD domain-containing protein [Gammaproteobacteria bacterium]MDH4315377.1 HDOD domain-containing protein [Gammaproteobacteria bacterium]MDH5214618.1 HDOD domain-containing protein [Gammaproteobacteria bacterium]MDH5502176.1 HDOD domain-containing protein [Gammaproteobacteria bacterium]
MINTSDTVASAKKIAQSIASLPPLPATAQEILTCFGDEFIDANKVSSVVEGDPGICARLLGLTNSAYFGLAEPVTSVHEAILRVLGVDTVRSLVLAMAIQRSFNSKDCPAFDTERFWISSLQTAECCKKIVAADESAPVAVRDLAYSTGLCHNLGLMALAHIAPEQCNSVLAAHTENGETGDLGRQFLDKFETNHRIVTSALAQAWSLPELMASAYQYRAFPDQGSGGVLGYALAAAVAAVGNADVDEERRTDLSRHASSVGMGKDDLQKSALIGDRQKDRILSLVGNMAN